ncbi:hypothetical protein A6R68_07596, partial [Neotoma lepida]
MDLKHPAEALTKLHGRWPGLLQLLHTATSFGLAAYSLWVPYGGTTATQVEHVSVAIARLSLNNGRSKFCDGRIGPPGGPP